MTVERELYAALELPEWAMLPDIGLYMDQVVTLLERTLSPALSAGEITKSMVNNYVKVKLIPRPAGKKYDREHLALLLMVAVLKQALSISDIDRLLHLSCAEGVQAGYTHFRTEVARMQAWLQEERMELAELADERQRAVSAGIAAALLTIHARQLLEEKTEI